MSALVHPGAPTSWVDATVALSRWPETVHGLLANAGANPHAIAAASGRVFVAPFSLSSFYHSYGDSWRVPAGKSLLAACSGKTANSDPSKLLYAKNLPAKTYAAARAICVGHKVASAPLLDACTVDEAVLGANSNAYMAFRTLPNNTVWDVIRAKGSRSASFGGVAAHVPDGIEPRPSRPQLEARRRTRWGARPPRAAASSRSPPASRAAAGISHTWKCAPPSPQR